MSRSTTIIFLTMEDANHMLRMVNQEDREPGSIVSLNYLAPESLLHNKTNKQQTRRKLP